MSKNHEVNLPGSQAAPPAPSFTLETPKPIVVKCELRERTNIPGSGPGLRYVEGELRDGMVFVDTKGHPEFQYLIIPIDACQALYVKRDKS